MPDTTPIFVPIKYFGVKYDDKTQVVKNRSNLFELQKRDASNKNCEVKYTCSVDDPNVYDMWAEAFGCQIKDYNHLNKASKKQLEAFSSLINQSCLLAESSVA